MNARRPTHFKPLHELVPPSKPKKGREMPGMMGRIRGVPNRSDTPSDGDEERRKAHQHNDVGGGNDDDSRNQRKNQGNKNHGNVDAQDRSSNKDSNWNEKSLPHQHLQAYDSNVESLKPLQRRRSLQHGGGRCVEGSSFMIVSAPTQSDIRGCYIQQGQYNGEAMYAAVQPETAVDGGHGVIGAAPTDPNDYTHIHWSLVFTNATSNDDDKRNAIICSSVDMAQSVHPADALWACDFEGKGSLFLVDSAIFDLSCGCSAEPSVADPSTPSPSAVHITDVWYGGVVVTLVLVFFLALTARMLSPFCLSYYDKTFGKRSLRPGTPTRAS